MNAKYLPSKWPKLSSWALLTACVFFWRGLLGDEPLTVAMHESIDFAVALLVAWVIELIRESKS